MSNGVSTREPRRQQSLDFRPSKRGGARPGAGRPRKTKGRAMEHRTRMSHRKDDPVHVTLRVQKRVPSLRTQLLTERVKEALLEQQKHLRDAGATHFQVVHFTIQEDHLHLIVEAPDKRGIARGVAGLEIRIARAINEVLRRKGRFWADRYHRRDLRTPTETRNLLRYVLLNLHKHRRVIGDGAFADPYSSAASFDGFARARAVFDDPFPWSNVTPRTWLLRTGWKRRGGLLDPADLPASSPYR
jgi:REP element-mobilizing transposase RayT